MLHRLTTQAAEPTLEGGPCGADVWLIRNEQTNKPEELRVTSCIYVYSDVVPNDVLARKCVKIQTQINNYWNNNIPATRNLTISSVGGTLAFGYDTIGVLSLPATGNAGNDAVALAALWANHDGYDAIGNATGNANGTISITFVDLTPRMFRDASIGSTILEVTEAASAQQWPLGQNFTAEVDISTMSGVHEPRILIKIVFDIEVKPYTQFASSATAAQRTTEMNRLRKELHPRKNLVWVHLNNDTTGDTDMISWASGGLGSWRACGTPGEYAHEFGHIMGHWGQPVSKSGMLLVLDVGTGGVETITLTLDGVVFVLPPTAGALSTTALAKFIAEQTATPFTGWTAIPARADGHAVYFFKDTPSPQPGLFTFATSSRGRAKGTFNLRTTQMDVYQLEIDPLFPLVEVSTDHCVELALMGKNANKHGRRVDQTEIGHLNFGVGLLGIPTAFPGDVLKERLMLDHKKIGHRISAQILGPPVTYVSDEVIYLDMSNFKDSRPNMDA